MRNVRILADDFTGALDAAAPFAASEAPVKLVLGDIGDKAAKLTISSESRDLAVDDSCKAVAQAYRVLSSAGLDGAASSGQPIWFKKVDSVLRGNSIAETIAMMRQGDFSTCIFAPAFPWMGRRTRDGMHEVRVGEDWSPASVHDLREAFAQQGLEAQLFAPGRPFKGVVIGDAVSQSDLDELVARYRDVPGVLWVGSRGLAQALAPDFQSRAQPRLSAVIVGTAHSVTRKQVAHAQNCGLGSGEDGAALIDPVPSAKDAGATTAALMRDVPKIQVRPGTGLMVIGGDTLSAVLAASDARSMECLGEIGPGLPISRIVGGQFDGVEIVTKSGGFGDAELLERMMA